MFGIGITEIVIIVVVALLFIKPEDFPGLLRKLGELMGQVKGFTRTMNRKMREAEYTLKLQEPPPEERSEKKSKVSEENEPCPSPDKETIEDN